jgi:hypothetical protein
MPGRPEHRRVATCPTTIRVAGWIIGGVRLGLDDRASYSVYEERAADERASCFVDAPGKRRP